MFQPGGFMKKSLLIAVVLVSLLAILVATAAKPRSAYLDGIRWVDHKGVVLTFVTIGKFYDVDLQNAYLIVNHNVYDLHCVVGDGGKNHVDCEAPGIINQYHGYPAYGSFAGFLYTTTIPKVTSPLYK
jgi:hypothetical protein